MINWKFFAIGHGKCEVDGIGDLLKRKVKKEPIKLQGKKLQNANEIVRFLKSKTNKYHVAHSNAHKKI
jgi:hypothetical protein